MQGRSLQARLLRIQQATMLLFVLGAAIFGWLMIGLDETIQLRFETVREIQVVRRAGSLLDAVLTGRTAEAAAEKIRMRAEFQQLTQADSRTSAVIHAAEKAVSEAALPRSSLLAVRGEVTSLLQALDAAATAVEASYAAQRLRVAALWAVILILPLGLAFFPLRLSAGVIAGIHQLAYKVRIGQETGDASHIPLDRDDEIGELNRAIDDMFDALRRREQDLAVARQLRTEQEKLTDVVSLTGGIAHEVANPLSVILANLDLMDDGGSLSAEIASIRDGLERIQALLRDVTAFASGEDQVDLIDVNGVVNGVFRMVRLDDRMRTAHFTANLDPTIPAVHFSRAALTLSLYSLITLAAAIIRETKGAMMVSSFQEGAGVAIAIWASTSQSAPCVRSPSATLPVAGGEVLSTLNSMNRVLKSFGGNLTVLESGNEVREFRLHIPTDNPPETPA